MGLDARYLQKRGDLAAVSRPLAVMMDWISGFGVHILKPLITFTSLVILLLATRILAVWLVLKARGTDVSPRDVIWLIPAPVGALIEWEVKGRLTTLAKATWLLALALQLFIMVQITVCSVYFSQTTLQ